MKKQLCHYSDIAESHSKGFTVEGTSCIAVKKEGTLFVYRNECPHLSIPLEHMPDQFLDSQQAYIICSNHGALFEIQTGLCISGPCVNSSLKSIPFEIQNNCVHIDTDHLT